MKVLDLFCGIGGWSDGFAIEGFEVIGVEINPNIAKLYKHPVIIQDINTLDGKQFKDYDVIVGSPPCRDFSIFAKRFGKTWKKNPPDPQQGLKLIHEFIRVVQEAKPKYWIMENVPGLIPYFKPPRFTTYLEPPEKQQMRRSFWGVFPLFLFPVQHDMKVARYRPEVGRKAKRNALERAKIPLPVTRAFAYAIHQALM